MDPDSTDNTGRSSALSSRPRPIHCERPGLLNQLKLIQRKSLKQRTKSCKKIIVFKKNKTGEKQIKTISNYNHNVFFSLHIIDIRDLLVINKILILVTKEKGR